MNIFNWKGIMAIFFVFIGIIVLFKGVAAEYPDAADAGDDLNASGFPLGSLFVGGGVVFLILAAVMIGAIIKDATKGM